MKAYTLSILTRLADSGHPIVDKEIIAWTNDKVGTSPTCIETIRAFRDH